MAGELLARVEHPDNDHVFYFRLAFCSICALQALIAGFFAVRLFVRTRRKLARSAQVEGEIVGFREHPGDEGNLLHPILRYPGADGKMVEHEAKFGRGRWSQKAGDRLQIYVDPEQPEEPEIAHVLVQWIGVFVLAGVASGGVLGFIVFYTWIG